MSLPAYRYALWQSAFELWREQSEDERNRLERFFGWLAAHPQHEGIARDYDANGRPIFLSPCGEYLVVHWPDHSARVVQIEDLIPS